MIIPHSEQYLFHREGISTAAVHKQTEPRADAAAIDSGRD